MGGGLIPNTLEEFPRIQVGIQGIEKNLMMTLSMEAKVSPKIFFADLYYACLWGLSRLRGLPALTQER